MTIGLMDNGLIVYVGEHYAGYIAYAVWGAAKRIDVGGRSLFDVIRELFYCGGSAGEFAGYFSTAADGLARELGRFLDTHGNPYFHVPDGRYPKLRDGRHGTVWGLYDAVVSVASMCEIYPNDNLCVEQICENEDTYG